MTLMQRANTSVSTMNHSPPSLVLFADRRRHDVTAYDPAAFSAGDATLGQWRRTVSQFNVMVKEQKEQKDTDEKRTAGASSSDSDHDGEQEQAGNLGGLHRWSPHFYHWIVDRFGQRRKVCLIIACVAFESLKQMTSKHAYVEDVRPFSILVVTNLVSLIVAICVSLFMEGTPAFRRVFSVRPFLRFLGVAGLFTLASVIILMAYRMGTPPVEVVTVGYIYMPLSVILSYYIFRRRYGKLEWLSVGMMTLSILTFVLLREESKTKGISFQLAGFGLVVGAVAISVLASILAERIFKDYSDTPGARSDKFYLMKIHLDFSQLVISVVLWMAPSPVSSLFGGFMEKWSHSKEWFGTWGYFQFLMVIVAVGQSWAAGLVTKEFSTVIKSVVQTHAVVLYMLLGDPLMGNQYHFKNREIPSILLAIIILMSAVIFQTGRINLKVIRRSVNIGPEENTFLNLTSLPLPENQDGSVSSQMENRTLRQKPACRLPAPRSTSGEDETEPDDVSSSAKPLLHGTPEKETQVSAFSSFISIGTTYALIVVYIISDAGRTLILQKALSTTVINSTSMGLVCYICGVLVASGLTLYTHNWEGLFRAWHLGKILVCIPAAFLFALATALGNLSFAHGITSSLYVVLGKFYTPVAALGARWIMGKFYMWLEWFALVILTLSSVVFGYLKSFDVASGPKAAPVTGMLLVLASAATSAVGSLVTEKILKQEKVPFHLQKVRLDAGSILSSLLLLPTIGAIATRPQDVPWAMRPRSYEECPWESACWQKPHSNHSCSNPDCHCECQAGVFAGWDLGWGSWVLALAVFVNTTQGWLVGKVTQRFSVVHRAIADSFSLLTVYFIGDPIFNQTSLSNLCLNLVAFIVPISTATFSVATSEMQKVFEAENKVKELYSSALKAGRMNSDGDTDSESELSEVSTGFNGFASPMKARGRS